MTEKKTSKEKSNSKGLCDNCINYVNCSYAKMTDRPVMFCEEYDFYSRLVEKYGLNLNQKDPVKSKEEPSNKKEKGQS